MWRNRFTFFRVIAAAVVVLLPHTLLAESALERTQVNGFVSQGYINSSGNNFLSDSEEGTFEFNEVGIAVNSQVNDKLKVGAQLLARDLGPVGNNEVRIDWGYADYHLMDSLGFRVGKAKIPFGLYNEGRDSDFLRPMVFLPQGIYDETKRDLLVAYQGFGVYGNVSLGFLGDLDYQGFVGSINFPDDSTLVQTLKESASRRVRATGTPTNLLTSFNLENNYIAGASVIVNTGLYNMRMGASILTVDNDMTFQYIDTAGPNAAPSTGTGELRNKGKTVYSVEIPISRLTLAGEYGETDRKQVIFGATNIDGPSQEWYGMATLAITDKASFSFLYDVYYRLKNDKGGNTLPGATPKHSAWRKDTGFSARYDFSNNWVGKLEYHDVNGTGLFMSAFNPDGLEQYWKYYALKASFNF